MGWPKSERFKGMCYSEPEEENVTCHKMTIIAERFEYAVQSVYMW